MSDDRQPVELFMESDGRYACLVACPKGGIEFTVVKIDKRLLNGPFTAFVIDIDDRNHEPSPEPELAGRNRR